MIWWPARTNNFTHVRSEDIQNMSSKIFFIRNEPAPRIKKKTFNGWLHPKTLFEMWIICLDRVSANSEKGRGSYKGGAEIAVVIRAERSSPRIESGTNCRVSVGN